MCCIEIWDGAVTAYKDVLIKLQKKIVQTMVSTSYNAHTTPILNKLNILTVDNIYVYFITICMPKYVKKIL